MFAVKRREDYKRNEHFVLRNACLVTLKKKKKMHRGERINSVPLLTLNEFKPQESADFAASEAMKG